VAAHNEKTQQTENSDRNRRPLGPVAQTFHRQSPYKKSRFGCGESDWRGKNAPTNVLSFPVPGPPTGKRRAGGKRRSPSPYIGDIVIAYETVAREAKAQDKPFRHHLAHLAIHGFLHLHGYDHENDREAQKMERLERKILAGLAIPDPYAST